MIEFYRRARMKLILILISIFIFYQPIVTHAELESLTLKIVPTRSSPKRGVIIDCATKNSLFYAVLTNISHSKLSVWREWCSWGYDNLSFKITLSDGQAFTVRKRPGNWRKNYPDPFVVKQRDHFVYSVRFDETWKGFPIDWRNQKVKIKAIFQIDEDEQAERLKVWMGKVESPELEVDLYK